MMIEFSEPPIQLTLTDYMNLVDLWKSAGSCAGFCISLGHLFFTEGVSQVDDVIQPLLSSSFAHANTLSPRVLPSYSILYWFALKVYNFMHLFFYRIVDINFSNSGSGGRWNARTERSIK